MKDWKEVSKVLAPCAPLVSALLVTNGGDILGALLAKELNSAYDPEVLLEDLQSSSRFDLVQKFESTHRNKLEAMLFTVMSTELTKENPLGKAPQVPHDNLLFKVFAIAALSASFGALVVYLYLSSQL